MISLPSRSRCRGGGIVTPLPTRPRDSTSGKILLFPPRACGFRDRTVRIEWANFKATESKMRSRGRGHDLDPIVTPLPRERDHDPAPNAIPRPRVRPGTTFPTPRVWVSRPNCAHGMSILKASGSKMRSLGCRLGGEITTLRRSRSCRQGGGSRPRSLRAPVTPLMGSTSHVPNVYTRARLAVTLHRRR